MAYPATLLITRSYYLSGVVAKGFQTVTGTQLNDGLELLNGLLAFKTANQRLIPYFNSYDFTGVIGQEKYSIPNLVLPETLVFFLGSVRFSIIPEPRRKYLGSPRAENIQSLPNQCHYERTKDGSDVYVYFVPSENFPFTIWGKFSLSDVTLNEDLDLIYSTFYLEYLRYALAEYICQENNATFLPQNQEKLSEFENILIDISPIDLTVQKMSMFQNQTGMNYAIANISRGFVPG